MSGTQQFRQSTNQREQIAAGIARPTVSAESLSHSAVVSDRPPVLIMNLFYTGIGIARNLAGTAVRVIGLSAHRKGSPGNYTRLCEVRFSPNSQEEPESLVEFLLQAAGELRGAVIFPTRDLDVLFLDRYRAVLTPHYRLAIPSRSALGQALDKHTFASLARQSGLSVPKTMVVRTREDLDEVSKEVGFPCVIKPISSHQWREGTNWQKVGGRKAFLSDSREVLGREYDQVSAAYHEVLAQEWIPGKTDAIVVLGGYVGAKSELLAYFTARKIVQSPDEYFGTGCLIRSEEIPALLEPTRRLFKALEYSGMAEVEYKFDARTGEYKLIELNARHWDQHELSRTSGVNLTWVAYADLIGQPTHVSMIANRPTIWIAEDPLIEHVLRGLYQRNLKLGDLLKQLRGPRIYGTFSWRDPWPFVRHFLMVTIPSLGKKIFQNLKKRNDSPGRRI
jgi:D-aspartate ligase